MNINESRIPLTSYILIHNGWGMMEIRPEYELYVRYFDKELNVSCDIRIYEDGLIYMLLEDINTPRKELRMSVKYVHELQNALKLFGIEKEIEL